MARSHALGNPRPRRPDGTARPRGPRQNGPVRAASPLRPRQNQTSGKRSKPCALSPTSKSPTSARGAGIPTSGKTGACKPCPRASATNSPAPPTASSPKAATSQPSAPTPTNCPWSTAALAKTDDELRRAPYDVLADWQAEHDGNLRIILPDTYGTEGFLERAPDWLAGWTGIRVD